MKKTISTIRSYVVAHKIIGIIVLLAIFLGGYWGYKKFTGTAGETRYITAKVEKGSIVVSVSGSGQVSALNQIDIKSKVSGDVAYLASRDGQRVGAGALIAQIDDKDAQKSARDAEINLESAKISLDKLKIQKSKENMDADLAKSYDDGFNTVSNVFLDLPEIMTGINDMFFKSNPGTGQWNVDWYEGQAGNEDRDKTKIFKQNFTDSYYKAKIAYDADFDNYKTVSRTSDNTAIETLILNTYDTTKLISDTIKNANNYIDFINSSLQKRNSDTPALINTHKNILSGYTSKTNAHLLNLLSIKTSIKGYKDAFQNSDLDIQSSELSVKQKKNSLQDAKDKLADYFVRAPFGGTIAKINIKKSDTVSAGAAVATLITKSQLAEISLNEVDAAKIKIGQKANLTFDAVPDLAITGVVADIDTIGTVSQGVVTYTVKISFDTQDERVKPAMSVSAAIITDTKQDALVAPNSAIKSLPRRGTEQAISYVEKFDAPLPLPTAGAIGSASKIAPKKIPVEIGLSNDSQSEIISGIKKGDEIVIRTILPAGASATTIPAPGIFGAPPTRNRSAGNGGFGR